MSKPVPAVVYEGPKPGREHVERQFERKNQGEEEVEIIQNSPGLVEGAVFVREIIVQLHLNDVRSEVLNIQNLSEGQLSLCYDEGKNLLSFIVLP